jgi:hypothetical protein
MWLLIILTVLVSSSAFAEMSQFYNNHVGGTVYGKSPNSMPQYFDNRGSEGPVFNHRRSDVSPYNFNVPSGMMQSNGSMFNAPMGNTPMGMPSPAPDLQQLTPMHPWPPSMPAGPMGR